MPPKRSPPPKPSPEPTPTPTPPRFIRGTWAILCVAVFCAVASLFSLHVVLRRLDAPAGEKWDTLWFAGDVIRAAGFTILAGFLGWYALAVWNHNGAPVGGWQIWESAHAYLWRCAALFILLHAIQTAMVLSRPAVPLPADQPRPQRQVIEE